MQRALIVIPTYNESENIRPLVAELFAIDSSKHSVVLEILVVDDSSPDGTGAIVKDLQAQYPRLHLLEREEKSGLGTAYVAGFKYALAHGFDYVLEMDADFSHDPKEIPNFLDAIQHADLVIGSRYITGANVANWPLKRLLLSYYANKYSRIVTGLPIQDTTGGFKCFRSSVLRAIDLDAVHSNGYSFQIEMNFRAWRKGFRLKEIPIVFIDRHSGESKMSKQIVREAVTMVWKLRFLSMFDHSKV